jgi:AcrR family transcriptional regulator
VLPPGAAVVKLCQMATAPRRRYAPRMPPEERREQLLDAALALIVERGYGGVTMEGIARAAGVTKPVVYDLFGSLGRLLVALHEREEERAFSDLAQVLPSLPLDSDPDQLLVEGLVAFLATVAANPDRWRLILLPSDGTPEVVREHIAQGRTQVLRQLESLVAWGLEQRGGPLGLDVELASRTIMALGEGAARLVLTEPGRFPPDRFRSFAAIVLEGLPRLNPPRSES